MRVAPAVCLAFSTLSAGLSTAAAETSPFFFEGSSSNQRQAEATVLAKPSPEKARRWLAQLTEEPHVAGTPQEKKVAEYVRDRFLEFGLEAEMVRYDVFLNHPKHVALRLTEPEEIELSLMEEPVAGDKDSSKAGAFPGFHGYGASGKASGQVVYVNYGTAADFKKLEEMGISVEGRIALVRYGQVFRGLKVKEAQEHGAVGIVIYSDPADDGYMQGDVYPEGPMRPPSGIQRGSVQYLSWQPGDPSTPGYPSTEGAKRLARGEMKTVPGIPSLPIGYGEAEKVLRHLGGPRVPEGWQGGLPFSYHVGPGAAALAMEVEMDEGLKPIWNVFGRLRGTAEPERLVILGNHRDAWVPGAVDPNSGTTAMLEAARALAAAAAEGWQPRRTIVFASWDAEEYGLVGSVEWGEDRAADLSANAVAYLNCDGAVTGSDFGAGGTPSLRDLVRATAADIDDPLREGSVGELWEKRLRGEWASTAPVELSQPDPAWELHLGALGSGSDYTVFLDHLGIPSFDFGFRGAYGVYHSIYDNFHWMEKHGDPQFVYHATAARFYALLAARLAAAEVLPLRFESYARALGSHLDDLRRRVIREARTPREGDEPRPRIEDFAPVIEALSTFESAGRKLDQTLGRLIDRQDPDSVESVNALLMRIERSFLSEDGLPGRPWFRHLLYAPGTTTGYAPWPFPELAEAVENGDAELFAHGAGRVVKVLEKAIRLMDEASASAR